MTEQSQGQVAPPPKITWVTKYAPAWSRPYLRLSRVEGPIGTWLLYLPCVWGVLLAGLADGAPRLFDLWIIIGCGLGALLMRGAGCTWNDITDRHIDGSVERTKSRPLPSGDVTVKGALGWMALQCLMALCILLTFNWVTILVAISSLLFVGIYPFAKRFTWWPQVFLGLAFNWGALVGWTAHSGSLGWPAVILYTSCIAWTLFYDTIYAHQDTKDDALIGVKSTARLFGDQSPMWLRRFLVTSVTIMGVAIIAALGNASILAMVIALGGPWAFGWHLTWQLKQFDPDNGAILDKLFRSNRDAGLLVALFFALALFG